MRSMAYMKIDTEKCVGCGECASDCPFGVPVVENGVAVIGRLCRLCGVCEQTCPTEAITFVNEPRPASAD